jgi:RNA polymerase sigma-70 factor (ECF subfamily)
MHTTSVSLLERLRQPGSAEAWGRFVDLYTPLLYYWACRLGLQEADAADLVQEVFTLLLQKLPEFTYDRDKSFRGWLRTVTLNKWREIQRRRPAAPLDATGPFLAELPAPDGLAEGWETEYRRQLVGRALELVRPEFQLHTWQAFWECAVLGRPATAVAKAHGTTANAVYLSKARVLRRLRRELEGLLG